MASRFKTTIRTIAYSKYLQRLLLSYVILLAFLLASSTVIYSNLLNKLHGENEARFEAIFSNTCTLLDERFNEAIQISDSICSNSELNHFLMSATLSSSEIISNLKTINAWLTDYTKTGGIIADYYIYDYGHEIMICPGGSTFRLRQQYSSLFQYDTLSFDEWKAQILGKRFFHNLFPNALGTVNNKEDKYLLLVTSIYSKRGTPQIGQLVMRLDPKAINSIIYRDGNALGNFRIIDSDGIDLLMQVDESDIEGKTYTLDSAIKGIKYTVNRISSPDEKQIAAARHLTNVIVIMSALFGFIISCFMAYRNSKQVIHIHANISGGEGYKNSRNGLSRRDTELNAIDRGITQLMDNSRELEKRVQQQSLLLRESFSTRLVYSYFRDRDEMSDALQSAGLTLNGQVFCAVFALICSTLTGKRDTALQETRFELEQYTDSVSFCIPVDRSKLALLAYGYREDELSDYLTKLLYQVHNDLNTKGINVIFCVGKTVANIDEVRGSFIDAERIAAVCEYTGTSEVVCKGNDTQAKQVVDSDYIERVKESALSGNRNTLNTLLDEIYQNVFEVEQVDQFRVKSVMYLLSAALMEACGQFEPEDAGIIKGLAELPEQSPAARAYTELRHKYILLCEKMEEKKKQHGFSVCEQVEQWVRSHYSDCELNISDIADHFGLNERYLTGLYKEYSGMTLWNFVIALRISEAERLLEDPDMSISEVAKRVGYLNVGSFRRMYKQHTSGALPSEKRKTETTGKDENS